MIRSIQDFEFVWSQEIEATQKILKHITDRSLSQAITPNNRTLGRLAWHLVTTIPKMMGRTGLTIAGTPHDAPMPATAREMFKAYNESAISLLDALKKHWTNESLNIQDDMYGQMWTRGQTLTVLIHHQIHHRGQMTVLMRQAGLDLPGIYGPTREEWAQYGMTEPSI